MLPNKCLIIISIGSTSIPSPRSLSWAERSKMVIHGHFAALRVDGPAWALALCTMELIIGTLLLSIVGLQCGGVATLYFGRSRSCTVHYGTHYGYFALCSSPCGGTAWAPELCSVHCGVHCGTYYGHFALFSSPPCGGERLHCAGLATLCSSPPLWRARGACTVHYGT